MSVEQLRQKLDEYARDLKDSNDAYDEKHREYLAYRNILGIDNPDLDEVQVEILTADNELQYLYFEVENMQLQVNFLEGAIQNLHLRIQDLESRE